MITGPGSSWTSLTKKVIDKINPSLDIEYKELPDDDPKRRRPDIKLAKQLGANCIEIHTGKICNLINKRKKYSKEFKKILNSVNFANDLSIDVHAGHGITFESAKILSKIKGIKEYNIGHSVVSRSVFYGLDQAVKDLLNIIEK